MICKNYYRVAFVPAEFFNLFLLLLKFPFQISASVPFDCMVNIIFLFSILVLLVRFKIQFDSI